MMNGYSKRKREYRRSHCKKENNVFSFGILSLNCLLNIQVKDVVVLAGYDCRAQRCNQCWKFGS